MNKHYLYLADNIDPEDFECKSFDKLFNFTTPIIEIKYLIYLANLKRSDNENEKNRIISCFLGAEEFDNIREYADKVRAELTQLYGEDFANLILLDFEREISKIYIDDAADYLENSLIFACNRADDFCHLLLEVNHTKQIDADKLISLTFNANGGKPFKTNTYHFYGTSKKTGKPVHGYIHEISNIFDALRIFFAAALKHNSVVSICQKCGNFFSTNMRCDQVYCDTCRQFSYDRRVKDETRKAYRKIYKMQHARLRRNKEGKSKEVQAKLEEKFNVWSNESRKILEQCEMEKKITLPQMIENLSSNDWLHKK